MHGIQYLDTILLVVLHSSFSPGSSFALCTMVCYKRLFYGKFEGVKRVVVLDIINGLVHEWVPHGETRHRL